jgi:hypothetical protein
VLQRAAVSRRKSKATFDRLPNLFVDETLECQRLLEELAAMKAEEIARVEARRLQLEYEAMQVLRILVRHWRKKKFRHRYYKRKSVTRLQSKFRGNLAKKKYLRNIMCRKIQARHRGKMHRRRALAWKIKVSESTITIQSFYRCAVARAVAKKKLPLLKRIELKHNRRMAALKIQKWWAKRRWQLLNSADFRKKVRRRKKQSRRGGSYGSQTRRSPKMSTKPKAAAAAVSTPVSTPSNVASSAQASAVISPTSFALTRTMPATSDPAVSTSSPSSSLSSSSSPSPPQFVPPSLKISSSKSVCDSSLSSSSSDKNEWKFSEFPTDFEKHINHDRALFERQRQHVSKILHMYDAKVRDREKEREF